MYKFLFSTVVLYILIFANANAEDQSRYYFKFVLDEKIGDGVLKIIKINGNERDEISPSKKELLGYLAKNEELTEAFGKKFPNKSFLTAISDNEKITFSSIQLSKIIKNPNEQIKEADPNDIGSCSLKAPPSLRLNMWTDPATEDLHVKPGEPYPIFAGSILHFKSITVDPGATIQVNDGRQKITFIKSDGDCKIDGRLVSRNFRSGGSTFEDTSPDGEVLKVVLDETNIGGKGGRGGSGSYKFCLGAPMPVGGQGALGTVDFGGGGGGGSRMYHVPGKCTPMQGLDANGQRGGKSTAVNAMGGDGAGRSPKRNGGYVYLKCLGKISLKGNLDFGGNTGIKGEDGQPEGAGGGGGGPGGQGGTLFLNKQPIDFNPKNFNFSGGLGGPGGKGGVDMSTGSTGENGKPGESGFDGDVELVE